ncbi:MAG: AI-2E family transporter [Methanobacteriaceae archaeon]|nr:AI-2E family transporter [Methanobacteriaceae archaeon]
MFISIIIYPFLMWLKKRGLSYNLSVIITLVGILALGATVIGFLVVSLAQLIKAIPTLTISKNSFLAEYGNQIITFIVNHIPETDSAGLISIGVFMLFSVIFLVYELPQIRKRLLNLFGADSPTLKEAFVIVEDFIEYFVIRTKVNLFYGIGVSAVLFVFDINFAILWGLLTFVLGYIPYIGIILAAIPPVLVAWGKYGIQAAIILGIVFVIINTIAESYIFPKLTGKGLEMSVYVVFVSVFVWGWILGPTGFFIGVPLTLIIIRYLYKFDETRWLASIMGSGGEEDTKKKEIVNMKNQ